MKFRTVLSLVILADLMVAATQAHRDPLADQALLAFLVVLGLSRGNR